MSDPVDRAQERDEEIRADAIKAQRARSGLLAGDWEKVSKKWCAGLLCGERIPDERRRAIPGVELCVDCQTLKEKEPGRNR